jgi:hypothetical protein
MLARDLPAEAVQRLAERRPAPSIQAIEAARQHLMEAERALAALDGGAGWMAPVWCRWSCCPSPVSVARQPQSGPFSSWPMT